MSVQAKLWRAVAAARSDQGAAAEAEAACGRLSQRLAALPPPPQVAPLVAPQRERRRGRRVAAAAAAALLALLVLDWGYGPPRSVRVESRLGGMAAAGADGVADGVKDGVKVLAAGDAVRSGDEVNTGMDSKATLRLPDGSSVGLEGSTSVRLERGWLGFRLDLERGKIVVRAARQRWGRTLVVTAGAWRVVDRGTVFSVARAAAGTRVEVSEGAVEVQAPGRTAQLHAGEALSDMPVAETVTTPAVAAAVIRTPQPAPAPAPAPPSAPAPPPIVAMAAPPALPQPQQVASAPAATQAAAAPIPVQRQLFDAARAAVADEPAIFAPVLTNAVASYEEKTGPAQAAVDFQAAFAQAHAIPADADFMRTFTDPNTQMQAGVNAPAAMLAKEYGEMNAIEGLLRLQRFDAALTVVRQRESGLPIDGYTMYLQAVAERVPATQTIPLVQECYAKSGQYPYSAALALIKAKTMSDDQRRLLIADAYRAAAGEAGYIGIAGAMNFMRAVHAAQPRYDTQMEDALVTMLAHLGTLPPLPPPFVPNILGGQLLEFLRSVDPGRAADLATRYPNYNVPPPAPRTAAPRSGPSDPAAELASLQTLPHAVANEMPGTVDRFRYAAILASENVDSNPQVASSAADIALADLTDGYLAAFPAPAAGLALSLQRLGRAADATNLMQRALSAADGLARQFDQNYADANGGDAALTKLVKELESAGRDNGLSATYHLAAELDFDQARAHVAGAHFRILYPVALAAVAAAFPASGGAGR